MTLNWKGEVLCPLWLKLCILCKLVRISNILHNKILQIFLSNAPPARVASLRYMMVYRVVRDGGRAVGGEHERR